MIDSMAQQPFKEALPSEKGVCHVRQLEISSALAWPEVENTNTLGLAAWSMDLAVRDA
jgi:hypothetical protein